MSENKDNETLDEERGKVIDALEDLLGADGRLVNTSDPWNDCFLEADWKQVVHLQITYGGPSVWIEVNLTDGVAEYFACEGLGKPTIRVPLRTDQYERLWAGLALGDWVEGWVSQ